MLEGDVGLGAYVRHLRVNSGGDQFRVRGPAQNLDHDGLLGGTEGLHCLVVGGLGQVLAIDLENRKRETNQQLSLKFLCFLLIDKRKEIITLMKQGHIIIISI